MLQVLLYYCGNMWSRDSVYTVQCWQPNNQFQLKLRDGIVYKYLYLWYYVMSFSKNVRTLHPKIAKHSQVTFLKPHFKVTELSPEGFGKSFGLMLNKHAKTPANWFMHFLLFSSDSQPKRSRRKIIIIIKVYNIVHLFISYIFLAIFWQRVV